MGCTDLSQPSSDLDKPPSLKDSQLTLPDRTLLFASPHVLSDPLINLYTETYTLFTSLQRIVASSFRLPSHGAADMWDKKGNLILDGLLGPPGAETVGHMRRLVIMYIEELAKLRGDPNLDVSPIDYTVITAHLLRRKQSYASMRSTMFSILPKYYIYHRMGEVRGC